MRTAAGEEQPARVPPPERGRRARRDLHSVTAPEAEEQRARPGSTGGRCSRRRTGRPPSCSGRPRCRRATPRKPSTSAIAARAPARSRGRRTTAAPAEQRERNETADEVVAGRRPRIAAAGSCRRRRGGRRQPIASRDEPDLACGRRRRSGRPRGCGSSGSARLGHAMPPTSAGPAGSSPGRADVCGGGRRAAARPAAARIPPIATARRRARAGCPILAPDAERRLRRRAEPSAFMTTDRPVALLRPAS